MKPICFVNARLAERGRRVGLLVFGTLAVAGGGVGSALAHPVITAVFDPGAGFSAADKAVIGGALDFYASNMTSNFSVTVAFGSQAAGGGASRSLGFTESYNAYYNALVANSSGDATDVAAIASLGGGAHVANPVTGTTEIDMNTTLASLLGLDPQSTASFADCGNLVASACITLSSAALNAGGTPLAGLHGIVQHEFDEVLGTSSALRNGSPVPANPDVADLYRYSAAGVRSFALNPSTDVPCTGSPTAFFSVNGGGANLQTYNNCNNGGDYGDWIGVDGLLVQDAFGPDTQAASLNLTSPEVKLLDAIGYNFGASIPEPATWALMMLGLGAVGAAARSRRQAFAAVAAR